MYPRLLEVTPTENGGTEFESERGMTLRDWFAGQALAGICAYHGTNGMDSKPMAGQQAPPHVVALRAFEVAEEMLKAREVQS